MCTRRRGAIEASVRDLLGGSLCAVHRARVEYNIMLFITGWVYLRWPNTLRHKLLLGWVSVGFDDMSVRIHPADAITTVIKQKHSLTNVQSIALIIRTKRNEQYACALKA